MSGNSILIGFGTNPVTLTDTLVTLIDTLVTLTDTLVTLSEVEGSLPLIEMSRQARHDDITT